MAVQPASLEILEKADLPPAQARAIVQVIELEIAGAKDTLATKHDLLLRRHETTEMGAELRQDMRELRHGLELRIEGLRGEMHAIFGGLLRHMYGAMLGQLAVLLGVVYFFVAHLPH